MVCCFTFILLNCDNFVDVELPSSQLTGVKVFENIKTAEAAMVDIYSKMRDTGMFCGLSSGLSVNMGLYADELTNYTTAVETGAIYANDMLPTAGATSTFWNDSYHQIYCSNAVIEGLEKSMGIPEKESGRLTGEALFTRALIHFYLVNIFGDIPYITVTDYEKNKRAERTASEIVYTNIIKDLVKAVSLLPADYISADRVRPNKAAAQALLSRVYLYHGDWAEASNAASAVLNNPLYVWESNLDLVFLKGSPSTIWQLMPRRTGNNTDEGISFIFNSGPPATRTLSTQLLNAFEIGDLRKTKWTRTISSASSSWTHAYKYKKNSNTGNSVEYSIVLRTAEQYLIRSEARSRQGDLIGAKEDLNKIRNTAGLGDTPATDKEAIIKAVLNERRVEFFTEYGHRFFDLKRTGNLDAVLAVSKSGWNSTDSLWPIPEKELLSNPFLKPQNPGY
ncbi:SusD family protein [Flavobacterium sp. ACN6]|nr:SusD family protein [Flavobacterium sp. ACN6]